MSFSGTTMQNATFASGHGTDSESFIAGPEDLILITGASGFIGGRLVQNLLDRGFRNLRCFTRPSSIVAKLEALRDSLDSARVEIVKGNLLSREDCSAATKNAVVIFHLAAGRGEKSFPDAFMNSVVATRNLLEASIRQQCLRRFVNVSSFSVYSNSKNPRWRLLDESSEVESHPEICGDAYSFAKIKQDQIVTECCSQLGIPYVIVRPGYVIGPGNPGITGRVGIGTFGIFMHLGGSNQIPFTYVDNCADAIALAGLKTGIDGEVFNVVDDNLPSSRRFLRLYKRNVRRFKSVYIPHFLSFAGCYLWERYSMWSQAQLEPVFNLRLWRRYWKRTRYSNDKIKKRLGWTPKVPMTEALRRYLESCQSAGKHA